MSYDSDIDRVRKKAELQGWRYTKSTNGHHQFYSPDKESIVTAAGTPSDYRGWQNFLSDMKRAGFKWDDFGSMGQALAEAKEKVEPQPPTPLQVAMGKVTNLLSASDHVYSLLKNNPTKQFHVQEVLDKVRVVCPSASMGAVSQKLMTMVNKGDALRLGHQRSGIYQFKLHPVAPTSPPPVQATATPTPPPVEAKPTGSLLGSYTGDEAIDADLRIMDNALGALGQIEEVVKRNRERLFKLAELKKLLGG